MYSTTGDLHKLLTAIKENRLVSENYKRRFLLQPQSEHYSEWRSGQLTLGFYFDQGSGLYSQSGNIDGSNAKILIDGNFEKMLVILCNTDMADLEQLARRIYFSRWEGEND